ncbi:hypothetical protein BT67DRAFT_445035 [Trichocladium antarcticum]|uniref:Uncharacterized protein n=1 Tax=Trichocladium antarcticum TaxID=1450529 RepID=A0AAN6UEC6_9PEZI|nr:hypothetical protein BT67DRAFT_445035 [Trichocladium antarcticum]
MAPTGDDDHYHPKDAIHASLVSGGMMAGTGLLFAAVRNSLAKTNIGPWAVFTKNGGLIAMFGAVGGVYEFTRIAAANIRERDDYINNGLGGLLGGAVLGLRTGRIPPVIGYGLTTGVVLAAYEFLGGSLAGNWAGQEVDEYERKEMLRTTRRRPIEETLSHIGEGRGIRPPGYEERRRQRIKERYGIEVNPVCADPDA